MLNLAIGFVAGSVVGPVLFAIGIEGYERMCKRFLRRNSFFS